MDFVETLKTESSRALVDLVASAVGNNPTHFKTVFDLCFESRYPVSMRASWVIQACCENYPELINPYIQNLFEKIKDSKVDGVKRNFLKIISEHTELKQIKDAGLLIDTCFNWLYSPDSAIAIKYYSMNIIYRYCEIEPDLKNEFCIVLEEITEHSSKGLKSRIRKILKELKK